jgi:Tfp pilus assembly protein PilF
MVLHRPVELDETVASAHIALALVNIFYDWDWAAAEAEYKRAVELSPGESVTHAHFADYLSFRGRHDEAIAVYSRCSNWIQSRACILATSD